MNNIIRHEVIVRKIPAIKLLIPNPIIIQIPNNAKDFVRCSEDFKSIIIEFERGRIAPNPNAIIMRNRRNKM